MLWDLAGHYHSNIVVIGGHGRKGPKKDETVLGTAIQYLSQDLRFPCMIIKDRKSRLEKPDGALRWGVCYDSSEKSKKVLQCVLSMMDKNDKLVAYTIREQGMASDDVIRHHIN